MCLAPGCVSHESLSWAVDRNLVDVDSHEIVRHSTARWLLSAVTVCKRVTDNETISIDKLLRWTGVRVDSCSNPAAIDFQAIRIKRRGRTHSPPSAAITPKSETTATYIYLGLQTKLVELGKPQSLIRNMNQAFENERK
ncbi:hypothetical protein B0J15DRAFT_468044 [Fusarium solani]|uniref:Uncharacterized protein n=1 Tax=Fusarium solani TaxID=169388 RepID=A0A9P9H1P0_FUSSL|nr:uncharacterized protein B0J15DRAFT_468044 [Fusarium solani]KAH7249513.1 hypothetical protein B0J15DRAFT_468044 [Fusarium solani]